MNWMLVLHLAATLFMTGIVWFAQIVEYPLFAYVGTKDFPEFERQHERLTTFLVGPMMTIELISGATIAYVFADLRQNHFYWAAGALLLMIWLSTMLIQVPCHQSLREGFDSKIHKRLIRSNWIRTLSWTLRSVILCLVFLCGLSLT